LDLLNVGAKLRKIHFIREELDFLESLPSLLEWDGHLFKRGRLGRTVFIEFPDRSSVQMPLSLDPSCFPSVDPFCASKTVIKLVKGEPFQDSFLRVEELNIEDMVVTAIPDLVILEETGRLLLPDLHIQQIARLLVGERDQVFIPEKGNKADEKGDEEKGLNNPIEAYPSGLKGRDLAVPGEGAECKEGGNQYGVGKGAIKGDFREFVEKIFENQVEGGLVSDEQVHLLEKEDDHINEDQTAQAKAENLEVFAGDIAVEGPVVFRHG
jgi:hypothetical protein